MNYPDNVMFSSHQFSSEKTSLLTIEQLLVAKFPGFISQACKMQVTDVISGELFITFIAEAELVSHKDPAKLQRLKIETNTPNTYMVSLRFKDDQTTYALSGRSTSQRRELARKLFLSGLSNANYDCSIEKARQDTLYSFSAFISRTLFKPSVLRIQQNVPSINNWLTKLLG